MKIMPNILFEEVERLIVGGSSVRLNVDGDSMLPFIHGGRDVVELAPVENHMELRRGEVILFRHGRKYIIHRITAHRGNTLVMRGDGNSSQYEIANINDVIAVLRYVTYPSGRVVDCRNSWWLICGQVWICLLPVRPYLMAFYRRLVHVADRSVSCLEIGVRAFLKA